MVQPENANLLRMADLLFDWKGFSCFEYIVSDRDLKVWLNPNQSGGQLYSNTSPYEVSEYSLLRLFELFEYSKHNIFSI